MKQKLAAVAIRDELAAVVGTRLRSARAKIGMTRKRLALASGTSERYLAHLEGGVGNPSLHVLVLADALDLPLIELLPFGGERDADHARAAEALRRLPAARLGEFFGWVAAPAAATSGKARRLTLIGSRGAGKSSLGQALAARLGLPFIEMTRQVEEAYGANVGLLIELAGQATLRRYETEAWQGLVKSCTAAVIAVPGGIVADTALYNDVLARSHAVWLAAAPEDHMKRVMAQGDFRPMSGSRGAMDDLKAILAARAGDYARAEARLDTSAQDFPATLALLEKRARDLLGLPA